MNVLITGGLGFIGSNLFNFMVKKYPNYELVILDSETYAADESNIENINNTKMKMIRIKILILILIIIHFVIIHYGCTIY